MSAFVLGGLIFAADSVSKNDPAVENLAKQWIKDAVGNNTLPPDAIKANAAKAVTIWRTVASDPRKAEVSKTMDTGDYVITLYDTNGYSASLWLRKDGSIKSISGY